MGTNQTVQENTVFVNDIKINYKIVGQGPIILVLHGWGGSSTSWQAVQEELVEQGYQVVTLDFPGFGKSTDPLKPWSVDDYVNFVETLRIILNIQEFTLVGHSFGGRVGIKYTVSHPDKVKKLILVSSAGLMPEKSVKVFALKWVAEVGNAVFSLKSLRVFKAYARNILYFFLRNFDYAKAKGVMRETFKKVASEDLSHYLPKIETETLLIWGEKDSIVPLKYGYRFQEKMKNAKLEILPGIGHSPHLEIPEMLAKYITNFCYSNK